MNIITPINQLGYGVAGLNIVTHLSKICNTSLFPIGNPEVYNDNDAKILRECIQNAQFPNFDSPCVRIWHQHDMSMFVGNGTKIGFPFFELDKFTEIEKHHLNSVDKLFVCSNWAKDICLDNLKLPSENIFVVPLGVDSELFKPCLSNREIRGDTTVFFNCGKWEVRKGHDVLVEIFNTAFSENDNVELWMMCTNPFLNQEENQQWIDKYKKSKLGSKIKIIPRLKSQQEVYSIMENIDCGIFPSRAEGWNLELLEILSCGKMAIASNISAHTEFCEPKAVSLVDIPEKEKAHDGKWFFGQGSWGKITQTVVEDFAQAMISVHKKHQENKSINQAGIETAKLFSWDNTACKIKEYA